MRSILVSFSLFLTFLCSNLLVQAEIVSSASLADVQSKIDPLLQDTPPADVLVAFDVDMTLSQPKHSALSYRMMKKYGELYKAETSSLTAIEKDILLALAVMKYPNVVVEKDGPAILAALQARGVKVIVMTDLLTLLPGKKDHTHLTAARARMLKKLGYKFHNYFEHYQDSAGDFFKPNFTRRSPLNFLYPGFQDGIFLTNGQSIMPKGLETEAKGAVLVALLKGLEQNRLSTLPKVIVAVDDRKQNLEGIEKRLRESFPTIRFVGIEYQGAFEKDMGEISAEEFQRFWHTLATAARARALTK